MLLQILSAPFPKQNKPGHVASMDVEPTVLAEADPSSADSLVSSNDPDDLANEQTWPTEEEMNGVTDTVQPAIPDAVVGTTPKAVRRIPKGMSEYQAAWIIEDEEDDEGDDGVERNGSEGDILDDPQEEEEEMVDMPMDDHEMESERRTVAFEDLDMEEEEKQ